MSFKKLPIAIVCIVSILTLIACNVSRETAPSSTPDTVPTTFVPSATPPLDPSSTVTPGIITTNSGLQYEDILIGTGEEAQPEMAVVVHFRGWFEDGTMLVTSYDREQPFEFILGAACVIQGWDEGLVGMKVGGKRKLIIPPELGYGEEGYPPVIPPGSTLIFEVELLEIGLTGECENDLLVLPIH